MKLFKQLLAKWGRSQERAVVEELEPRILYSADFSPAILDPSALGDGAEHRILTVSGEFAAQTQESSTANQQRRELVFVDSRVPDLDRLIADLTSQRGRQLEIVKLGEHEDGLARISQILEGRHDIAAVHLISHGADGEAQLGASTLNFDGLLDNAAQIKNWGAALTDQADLLIYGCDVAATEHGEAMLRALSRLTGADVAASTDLTGNATLGGDWILEERIGQVEATVVLSSELQQSWQINLAITPQGGETLVNSGATIGTQETEGWGRSVAMDASGNYVVVGQDNTGAGGDAGYGVYVQRYNASGVAQGSTIHVNTYLTNDQRDANVAMDANGNFVIAWQSQGQDGSSLGVYARRYNAAGVAQGAEFLVSQTTLLDQSQPAIAMDSAGNFVVTWASFNQDATANTWGVFARRFDAAGNALSNEFQVNTYTISDQDMPSIGMDSAGNFVIAWPSLGQDGTGWGIYAQRYNAAGVAQGAEFRVSTTTGNQEDMPSVAMNATGFVVAWESSAQDGSGYGIYAQRYNAAGVAQGGEIRINSTTANDQKNAIVAMTSSGGFVVTWQSLAQDGSLEGVYLRQFDASGTAVTSEMLVNTTTTNAQRSPSLALNGAGNMVVVWSGEGVGDTAGVFMQRFSLNQAPVLDTTRSPALAVESEDAGAPSGAVGSLVSSLVDFDSPAGQVDNITDADAGALLGIAVTAADTSNGTWWYSTDGGTNWNALGAVSNSSARLLAADGSTRLYFQPNANFSGPLAGAVTFRAWDQTTGSNGALADTSVNGGATAFSTATDSASLTVAAVNDPPVNTVPSNRYTALNTAVSFSTAGGNAIQIADVDAASSAVRVSLAATNGTLTLASTAGLTLVSGANGSATFTYSGSVSAFNTALGNGVTFTPTTGYRGLAQLTLTTDDQGNTGSGGALSDSDIINVHVGALVVTNTNDASNGAVTSIANLVASDGGDGISLREAIQATNATANVGGPDYIYFNIAGAGPHVINLSSALPAITGAVVLDATTDDSWAANGNLPAIELNGTAAGAGAVGLNLTSGASSSTIRGLAINRFSSHGILLNGADNVTIAGNHIGVGTSGLTDLGNGANGIQLNNGAQNNIIGGLVAADRNVISGNGNAGIAIDTSTSTGNQVIGNYIGVGADGSTSLGNTDDGVHFNTAGTGNIVGSALAGGRNVISANGIHGVGVGDTSGVIIIGNYIGTDYSGSVAKGNAGAGVQFASTLTVTKGVVGGTNAGEGNLIAFNAGDGVYVKDATITGVQILGNNISRNSGLGIDLGANGVTANDAGDTDAGANNLQNFPVLTSAASTASGTTVVGTLNSNANTTYRIEFFGTRPAAADATNGEGERYLGFLNITTDGSGNASFNTLLADAWVNHGDKVTATATVDLGGGNYGSTSEFAANVTATATGIVVVDTVSDAYDSGVASGTVTISTLGNSRGTDGRISLREAIYAANNTANGGTPDKIVFAIDGIGPHIINLSAALPAIAQAVVIDASSEPDYAGAPVVVLNGGGTVQDGIRLYSGSDGSTIRGLVVQNFTQFGIHIDSSNGNTIAGNWIGLNAAGTGSAGNATGILIWNSNNNVVGGSTAADRNVISGNTSVGVGVDTGNGTSTGNKIQGNYIGTNATGTSAVGNGAQGVWVNAASTTIGGTAAGQGNVISGTTTWVGVQLEAPANNTLIAGNIIGLNASGTAALSNAGGGIYISSANNTIGGITSVARNIVSGNGGTGITFTGAFATGNVVIGNYIGTDITGTLDVNGIAAVGGMSGVVMDIGASNNRIGTNADGTNDAAERNIISGNNWYGVEMLGAGTTNNVVQGNYIGTDVTGLVALGNSEGGVSFWNGATNNRVGSGVTGARNIVSGNHHGVLLANGVSNNRVQGNYIGIGADGTTQIGNSAYGVLFNSGGTNSLVTGNIVGTDADGSNDAGERNVISANFTGIALEDAEVSGNTISGNYIGTDATGLLDRGNQLDGILIQAGAHNNAIGGTSALQRNVISGNGEDGVRIIAAGSSGNVVLGNYIGVNANGNAALANDEIGVHVLNGASNNTIGGTSAGARNVISGNTAYGVNIEDPTTANNTIQGNYIGVDATGSFAVSNGGFGIVVDFGATGTTIGGTALGAGNVISGNTNVSWSAARGGIYLSSGGTTTIQGNTIGLDASRTVSLGNGSNAVAKSAGIYIAFAPALNIGGIAVNAGNVIAGNFGYGIMSDSGGGDFTALSNNIYGNARLGIDLGGNGVTANDVGDADPGENNLQNFPVLTNVVTSGSQVTISGSLNSTANTDFRIELFASSSVDASGYGEGQRFLGAFTVNTGASGTVNFTNTIPVSVLASEVITATATEDQGGGNFVSTSEFSAALASTSAGVSVIPVPVAAGGETRVNTTTASVQATFGAQSVAMDASGNYVVVWQSFGQDAAGNYGVYAQRYNANGVAQGSEFLVNVTTADQQGTPSVAMDASGNFVVVWQSANQDGSGFGVYARRFNSSGTALGGEFLINQTTANNEWAPSVAMNGSGAFVVTWVSVGQDGSGDGVYARRYNASGVALGNEFLVNQTTALNQNNASVAVDAAGGFVIVWASDNTAQDGSGSAVLLRRYDSAGAALSGETLVATTSANDQARPRIDMDGSGNCVVVWESNLQDGSGKGIYARRFNAAGLPLTAELQINQYTNSDQYNANVAADANGNFVVTWTSTGQDGYFDGVYARRFAGSGIALGSEFKVANSSIGNQNYSSAVLDSSGRMVIVWSGDGASDGNSDGVFLQRYSFNRTLEASGSAQVQIVLNTAPTADVTIALSSSDTTEGTVSVPSVTFTAANWNVPQTVTISAVDDTLIDGDITYSIVTAAATSTDTNYSGFNPADVSITNVDTDTASILVSPPLLGSEFRVNTTTANEQNHDLSTSRSIAVDGFGNYVVVWASQGQDGSGWGVYAQRFNAAGVAQGGEILVNTTTAGDQTYPAVAMASNGNFVVVWKGPDTSSGGIFAQRFNSAGVAQGAELQVNQTWTGDQDNPNVAMDGVGNFVVTWSNPSAATGSDIYARRFDAAGNILSSEFFVNSTTADAQNTAQIAMNASGAFVVTWQSYAQDGSDYGVYAQRYDAAGVPQGAEFRVNTTTVNRQWAPPVAMDGAGNFVVAWVSDYQDGALGGIYAQRFNASGVAQGGEFRVNTTTADNQSSPNIAMKTDGEFVVVWASQGQDGALQGSYGQRYSAAGAALGGEFRINTTTAGEQADPDVAMAPNGDFMVVWRGNGSGDADGIFAQRFAGTARTTEAGGTTTFSIVLNSQPTANVTVNLTSSDVTEGSVIGSVTFTALNWNIPQLVTVAGLDDAGADGNINYSIVTAAASSTDGNYSGVNAVDIAVTNIDNDGPVNLVPGAQSTNEDSALVFSTANGNAITVSYAAIANARLQVALSSTNGTLTLSQLTGLTVVSGANGSSAMVIDGAQNDINAALNGMSFLPGSNYNGAANVQVTTSLSADLQGLYTFNAGNASDDSAGTAQNGAFVGNATTVVDGTRGTVLTLDGVGDSVQIPNVYGSPTNVTIGGWVNLISATGRSEFISINDRVHVALDDGGNGVKGSFQTGAASWDDLSSGQSIAGTGWHHVMYSYDDTNNVHSLYIDGALVASEATTSSIYWTGATTTYIGQHPTNGWYLNGSVDDVRIYNRALSAAEIASIASDQYTHTDNVAVTVNAVNDAPSFVSLDASPAYTENAAPVVLDNNVTVADAELTALNNFNGATLTLARNGGAHAQDVFSATGTLSVLTQGGALVVGGTTIGTVTTNSGGTLVLTFNASATNALVNSAMQQIAYSNSSDAPPASVQINWTFNDGNTGTQGSGGALQVFGSTTVNITALSDAPVNAVPGPQNTNEDVALVFSSANGNSVAINDLDAVGDVEVTLSVTNGALTLGGTTGLVFLAGDGISDAAMTVRGTVADINAALNGMSFVPAANFSGGASLTVATKDSTLVSLDIDANLQARYTFEGSANDVAAGPQQNGTLQNGAAIVTDPTRGQVLSLDGINDYVELSAHTASVAALTQGTISGWIKATGTFQTIFSISDTADTGSYASLFLGASGYLTYEVVENGVPQLAVYRNSAAINDGNWHHVAVTIGASGNQLFVDGEVATSAQLTYDAGTSSTQKFFSNVSGLDSMAIGRNQDSSGGKWYTAGALDDVRLYSRALSATEVAALSSDLNLTDGDTVSITVNPVNDQPSFNNLDGTPNYTENGAAIALDNNVTITDLELSAANNFTGATLTLARNGGANTEDVFAASGTLSTLTQGGALVVGGTTIGTVTTNSAGTLLLTFNASATDALVNSAMQQIAYSNSSDAPPASVQINWTFNDGNAGSQGSGGALQASGSTTVAITAVNDPPSLFASASVTVLEDGSYIFGAGAITLNDADAALAPIQLTITATQGTFSLSGTAGLTFSTGDGSNDAVMSFTGTLSAIGAALTNSVYTPTPNYSGVASLQLDASDLGNAGAGGTLTASRTIAITVTPQNDAPVITSDGGGASASVSVAENTTAVTTVTTTDVDLPAQTLTYSIVGGADAAIFSINASTGALSFLVAPNYEVPTDSGTNNVYDVTVQVSDGNGGTDTQAISVTITPVNDNTPVITSNGGAATASVNVAENSTAITTVTAIDVDLPAQSLTYSIVGGADAAKFAINASTGALSFLVAPNYEAPTDAGADNVYDVTVQVSDGTLTDSQAIAVTVTPVNDNTPVITSNGGGVTANVNVAENSTAVSTVTASDADLPAQALTYSISGGADASKFTINASTGVLSFLVAPNYEAPTDAGADNVYDVTVQVSDGTNADSQAIAVTVTPTNDNAPVITSDGSGASASINVAENGAAVTTVTATDADLPAQSLTYSIIGGADASKFTINATTGALSFSVAPNYEAPTDVGVDNIYDVTVQVSDGTNTDSQAIAVTVTPINDNAPVITSDGASASAIVNVTENSTAVTTVSATDADLPAQSLAYSIVGGADAAKFSINASTGVLSFFAAPDFEAPTDSGADNVYDVIVQVSDGSLTDSQAIAVTVTSVNDNLPTITSDGAGVTASVNVAENGTTVTTVTATDADLPAQSLTYSIVGGADAAKFTINASTGVLSFSAAPDFETPTDSGADNVYDVIVQVSDGTLTDSQAIAVTVTPVNDNTPVITSDGGGATASVNVTENSTAVTTVTATDADLPTQSLTYSIIGGADAAKFAIDASTGALSFLVAPNYEAPTDSGADNVYDVTVQVSDGTLTDSQAIAVTITPVNDNTPVVTSNGGGASASISVAENSAAVTTVTATDADLPAQSLTYSIVGGADAAKFSINAATGALSFLAAPNYESPTDVGADNVYDVTVQVSDGTFSDSQSIAVAVTPINDNAPAITSNGGGATASVSIAENTTAVTTVSATDADLPAQSLSYSIIGGADAANFSINAATGALSFLVAPDFEAPADAGADNVYDVTVQVSDGAFTDVQAIAVTVTPVNDNAPVITSDGGGATANVNVAENATAVTILAASDADLPAQTLLYSIVGGADAAHFSIDANTGALSFAAAPDYEAPADAGGDNIYNVIVRVDDGNGAFDTQSIAVTITPVNDNAPVITSDGGGATANLSIAENGTAVTTVTASDTDLPAQTLTYAISGGADAAHFSIDVNTGALTFISAPDFEAPADADSDNVYQVTVQVADGSGGFDTQALSIAITNVGEVPVNSVPGAQSVNEDIPLAIGGIAVNDVDGDLASVQISVANGTLTVDLSGGASISAGANASGSLTLVGSQAQINSALASITYLGNTNFNGIDNLSIVSTDSGALSDSDVVAITVASINDAPVTIVPGAQTVNEDTALVFSSANGNVITIADVDAGAASVQVSLSVANGTLTLAGVTGLTFTGGANGSAAMSFTGTVADINAALDGLSYLGALDFNGSDTLSITSNDLGASGAGGALSDSDSVAITVDAVNDTPTVANPIADQAATEDSAFNFQFAVNTFNDVDAGDSLTYSASGVPAWLNFNAATRTFSGTPLNADVGSYTVIVRATDLSGAFVEDQFNIVVGNTNDVPTVANPIADQAATEDAPFNFQFAANTFDDVDAGDSLTYSASGVPAWLNFNAATRTFSGTPLNADVGSYTVTLRATDLSGAFVEDQFDIVVANTNDAPTVANPIADQAATEDAPFNFQFAGNAFDDVDVGDNLTYSASGVPAWLSFNAATRTFSGTPLNADVGAHTITVRATDMSGAFVEDTFDVVVANSNDAPTVINAIVDQSATEDAPFSFQFAPNTFNDVDVGDNLTYSASGLPAWLSFNAATRTFSGTPANADVGSYTITVRATDLSGAFVEDQFSVAVANTNDAPTATDNAYGTNEDSSLTVNASGLLQNDNDVDGDVLHAVLVAGPSHGQLTLNSDGSFTYAPDRDFFGVDTFSYRASDGTADSNIAAVTINVAAVNDAPAADGLTAQTLTQNATITLGRLVISDVDSSGPIEVVLAVDHGSLQLASTDGISFVEGANGAARIVMRGSLAQLNAALVTIRYTPDQSFVGTDLLRYAASDGVDISPQRAIEIRVAAMAELPPNSSGENPAPQPSSSPPVEQKPIATTPLVPTQSAAATAHERDDSGQTLDLADQKQTQRRSAALESVLRRVYRSDIALRAARFSPYEALLASLEWQPSTISQSELSSLSYEGRRLAAGWRIERQESANGAEEESTATFPLSVTAATGISLSVGAVLWALRAGGLAAALAASTPLWRHLDPLPILGRDDEEEEGDVRLLPEEDSDDLDQEEAAAGKVLDHAGSVS